MKDDELFSDLEARLRSWRPAEMPAALRARLQASGPVPRPVRRQRHALLAGACALALGIALLLSNRAGQPLHTGSGPAAAQLPGPQEPGVMTVPFEPRWVLGESLTMNIDTGVPPGIVPAALRLDDQSVTGSGLLPVRFTDGKLPLKVDCQF